MNELLKKYPLPWKVSPELSPMGERLVKDANDKPLFYIDPDMDAEDAGNRATALYEDEALVEVIERMFKDA